MKEIRREIEGRAVSLDLSELVRELEDMKELHRLNLRALLPARYTSVRRKLIAMRAAYPILTIKQKSSIRESINQFSELERILDSGAGQVDPVSLNLV